MTSYYYQDNNIQQAEEPSSPRINRESIFSPTPEPSQLVQTLSNEVNLDLGTFDLSSMSNNNQLDFNQLEEEIEQVNDILLKDIQLDSSDKVIEISNQPHISIEDSKLFSDITEEDLDAELDEEFLEKIYNDIDKDDQEWLTQTNTQTGLGSKDIDPLDWLNSRHEDSPINLPNLTKQQQTQGQKHLPLGRESGPVSSLPLLHHDPTLGDIGDFDGFTSDDNDLFFDGGIVDTSKTNDYMLFGVTEEDLKDTNLDAFSPKGWDIDDEFTIDELLAPIPDLPPLQSEMMAPPDPEVAALLNQFRKQMRSNENSRELNSALLSPNSSELNGGKSTSYQQDSSIKSNSHSRSISIDFSSPQQSINTPPRLPNNTIQKPPPSFNMSKVDSSRRLTKPKISPPPNFQSRIPVLIPGYSLYSRRCSSPLEPEFESKIPSIANGKFKPKLKVTNYYYQSPNHSYISNDLSYTEYS